ncbi:MAG: hypothetical protein WC890_00170 [Candidatus Margulisiibacteriota bacterium]
MDEKISPTNKEKGKIFALVSSIVVVILLSIPACGSFGLSLMSFDAPGSSSNFIAWWTFLSINSLSFISIFSSIFVFYYLMSKRKYAVVSMIASYILILLIYYIAMNSFMYFFMYLDIYGMIASIFGIGGY